MALQEFSPNKFLHRTELFLTPLWNVPNDNLISFEAVVYGSSIFSYKALTSVVSAFGALELYSRMSVSWKLLFRYFTSLRIVPYASPNVFSLVNISFFAVLSASILTRISSSLREESAESLVISRFRALDLVCILINETSWRKSLNRLQ